MWEGNLGHFKFKPSRDQIGFDRLLRSVAVNPIVLVANESAAAGRVNPDVVPCIAFEKGSVLIEELIHLAGGEAFNFILHRLEALGRGYQQVSQTVRFGIEDEEIVEKVDRAAVISDEDSINARY